MSAHLSKLLEHALAGEPALADEVDAVFRRADRLRHRRARAILAAGVTTVAAVVAAGALAVTAALRPDPSPPPPVRAAAPTPPVPSSPPDPVLAVIAPVIAAKKLKIHPRPPERGNGWRQYAVTTAGGEARGTVQVAVYESPRKLCFPVLAAPGECARPEKTGDGLEYLRYDDVQATSWLTRQTIAHRPADGRTLVLMAVGERAGRPPLSGTQVQKLATDLRLLGAFGDAESCSGSSASACPVFPVPVPRQVGE